MGGGEGLLENNEKGWVFVSNSWLLAFAPEQLILLFSVTPLIHVFCNRKHVVQMGCTCKEMQ